MTNFLIYIYFLWNSIGFQLNWTSINLIFWGLLGCGRKKKQTKEAKSTHIGIKKVLKILILAIILLNF